MLKLHDIAHCLITEIKRDKNTIVGPLSGIRYVVKDVFDVAGVPTTAGNPDFASYRGIPSRNAWVVDVLAQAGAELVGKANLHEMAYGITGINPHYGTPKNPHDPERIPGGSSSGSAAAVGAGAVPFAIGTDTGGSVRVPASFCGVWGFRPSHDFIPTEGVVPLAPSFDTVGVFANSCQLLAAVVKLLLRPSVPPANHEITHCLVAVDALDFAEPEGVSAVQRVADAISSLNLSVREIRVGLLRDAFASQRIIQAAEAWATHQEWIIRYRPRFGPDVARLFENASQLEVAAIGRASAERNAIVRSVDKMLGREGALVMPAAPGVAPKLSECATPEATFKVREKILLFTNLASLCGLPTVVIPASKRGELPVGVAVIGPRGSDLELLKLADRIGGSLDKLR